MTNNDLYGTIPTWAVDFVRALIDRPLLIKILLRPLFGKYAYREFVGMVDSIKENGWYLNVGYGLEECNYHKDKIRKDWWNIE